MGSLFAFACCNILPLELYEVEADDQLSKYLLKRQPWQNIK